jgi:hypothetical protein
MSEWTPILELSVIPESQMVHPSQRFMTARVGEASITVPLRAYIARLPRHRCPGCGRRRLLYTIRIGVSDFDGATAAYCAACLGVRDEHTH